MIRANEAKLKNSPTLMSSNWRNLTRRLFSLGFHSDKQSGETRPSRRREYWNRGKLNGMVRWSTWLGFGAAQRMVQLPPPAGHFFLRTRTVDYSLGISFNIRKTHS